MSPYIKEIKKLKNENKIELSSIISGKILKLIPAKVNDENIRLISIWREQNSEGFLTKFNVTQKGTKEWLKNIWCDPKRILLMIIFDGEKIGHVGIHRYYEKNEKAEIDSVLRAVRTPKIKIMENVFQIIFKWMFTDMKLKKIIKDEGWIYEVSKDNQKNLQKRFLLTMEIKNPILSHSIGNNMRISDKS